MMVLSRLMIMLRTYFRDSTPLSRCFIFLVLFVLLLLGTILSPFSTFLRLQGRNSALLFDELSTSNRQSGVRSDKFLEVPQIVWGLNNQKIAIARACLTARFLNRTLLMPSLSASLFYKEVELLKPLTFDKIFNVDKFNSLCHGFVQIGWYSHLLNQTKPFVLEKGSGRRWTVERDLEQLRQCVKENDGIEVVRIEGKNPFLWQDHWSVKDYSQIFKCLIVVDEIEREVATVISKIKAIGANVSSITGATNADRLVNHHLPYVAVHMRIEIDWMIHCKKSEKRLNIRQICSSKEEIMERVALISGLPRPVVVYLAVADSLLEDNSILSGWENGLLPYEKKRLGVWDIYKKYPYLVQSAIDYEVCSRADVFIGNSFSTFSSLIVLSRTQKMISMGYTNACDMSGTFTSYAYNIRGDSGAAMKWVTDMSSSSLLSISYGTNNISCYSNWS